MRLALVAPAYVVSFTRHMGKGADGTGGRQYCHQNLTMSATGAFAGEEQVIYSCGEFDCPVEVSAQHLFSLIHAP